MPGILVLTQTPLLKVGIRSILRKTSNWHIYTTSGWDPERILEIARHISPEVTILEDTTGLVLALFETLGREGVDAFGMKVVVTGGYQCEETLFQLAMWGVAVYLSARISVENFVETIERVSHGEYLLDSEGLYTAPLIPQRPPQQEQEQVPDNCPLSVRRLAILTLLAQGMSNKEIGGVLGISHQTAKNHITAILKQLGVRGRIPAITIALSKDWIELPTCPAAQGVPGSLFAVA
jgi:DNA-binding NarL/FixJ family response regulator